MSKSIKNIIAAMFICAGISVTAPSCLNFTLIQAFAEDKPSLRSIYLSEGDNIRFSEDVYSYIVDVDDDAEELFVKAKPYDAKDTVKINGQVVTKDDYYKENVKLEKGKNVIEIEVIDDKTKDKEMYKVYVYRGGKEAVYLQDITLNGRTIGFNKTATSYNLELDQSSDTVELETIPQKGDYSITVNDSEVSENNTKKLKFKSIGKYTLNIGLKDNDTDRTGKYTLNIYMGIPVSPNVSDSINNVLKPNQWVLVYGRWRYNDSLGDPLKNVWFFDNKYKSYFHFNDRGNMQTEWIQDNGKWYYLNAIGAMQTGWLYAQGEWYFLGSDGAMKIGWLKDGDKWYYLRRDGSMATGWIVSQDKWYYLNSSGVMQTGWIYYGKKWYYLKEDGSMATGWINDNNQWYYLESNGNMKSGEWFYYKDNWYYLTYEGGMRAAWWLYQDDKYYYFNEDGTLRTSPITINGYLYEFNQDGSVNFY